ncbi:MAG: toll/interleukin-1 receptor domain-containing protein [Methanobrevibacter sp.]|nr:toll/interleukin-1 receptor domain-containing protein [Methanobrevibacter sp.]
MGEAEYRKAIMQALDMSDHFIVVISDLEYLSSKWIEEEMSTFHSEMKEGRKENSNFLFVVTEEVMETIICRNKKCFEIDYRRYEIIKISEFKEKLINYIK